MCCIRVCDVADEHGGAFAHGRDGVFLDLGVGGEDALGEPLDHCPWKGEVLRVRSCDQLNRVTS